MHDIKFYAMYFDFLFRYKAKNVFFHDCQKIYIKFGFDIFFYNMVSSWNGTSAIQTSFGYAYNTGRIRL